MGLSSVQILSAQITQKVAQGHNLDESISDVLSVEQLSSAQVGALKDLCFGCQRYLGTLTFYLRNLVPKPLTDKEIENLLLVAIYQLTYTKNAPHAVVNEAVLLASKLAKGKFKNLVNAVLRNFLRQKEKLYILAQKNDEAKYNHPQWLLNYLKQFYPKQWHNIITANQSHPPMTLRINKKKIDTQTYLEALRQKGIEGKKLGDFTIKLQKPIPISILPGFELGWVSVQDFGAQQAALLLEPQDNESILDACAAPGGKTGHLLELAHCQVTALEIDPNRVTKIQENLERLGERAIIQCVDASELNQWYNGEKFDAILADVPCSASGVIRRHSDIKWLRQKTDAHTIAKQQLPLLDALWQTLKSGGRMLLATCSIFHEENTEQTKAFLSRHSDASLIKEITLLPCEQNDGFYYALLQKN
ncbi:16S rRNA (cytosine(967)-C(5))-methyltransferase RsmB [Neisseria sp. Ec49-e6-T10]|uniref:16S rRNA (cytosine(967)-C(5))-methyltransferase RsmB n=1 Tax=Neisseria sp. Ec49-e6-T10 TaxID=3140744 RepID=UPI003EB8B479